MRVVLAAALAGMVIGPTAGCGPSDRGGGSAADVGVSLEMRHTEPLRSGAPVRWALVLRNDTPRRIDVRFPSAKDGDVSLRQGGKELYRWSTAVTFTDVVRDLRVGAGETRTFALEDPDLDVPAGDYDLVASLATEVAPPPAEQKVTVVA